MSAGDAPGPVDAGPETAARERLIRAASRLFYRHGIHVVGIDAIVRAAGVARMTLYNQFGSKDGLIAACLNDLDTRYHEWFVGEVARRAPDPPDRVLAVFDVLDEWFRGERFRGCAFINAAVELSEADHPGHVAIVAHKRRTREYLATLARDAGLPDPGAASEALMLLVEGATATALVEGDRDAALRARRAAEALLAGMTTPAPVR